jgi:splicing factor 3B subunit 2
LELGGNPFGPPGSGKQDQNASTGLVTSDGKTVSKSVWGGLPTAEFIAGGAEDSDVEESSSEEESSDEDMEGSDVEQESGADGIESVLPPPSTKISTAPGDLRKQQAGDETPLVDAPPKQLYQVLEQSTASDNQSGAVFSSEVKYMVPGTEPKAAAAPEGAESVLSKAMPPSESAKRKRKLDADEDDEDLGKNFKF